MQEIGRILSVQVQRSTLKPGKRLATYYDPTPLLVAERLRLTPQGVIGITCDGTEVMDLHHIAHPTSHNTRGLNGISFLFSSHYQSMREAYGDHIVNGCAGENVLIEANKVLQRQDLGSRLAIRIEQTGRLIYLSNLKIAAPCIEFSQYAANHGLPLEAAPLKATLQFLHQGRRGFYATAIAQETPVLVKVGDRVFVVDEDISFDR